MEKMEQATNEMSNCISRKGSNEVFGLIDFSEKNSKSGNNTSEK